MSQREIEEEYEWDPRPRAANDTVLGDLYSYRGMADVLYLPMEEEGRAGRIPLSASQIEEMLIGLLLGDTVTGGIEALDEVTAVVRPDDFRIPAYRACYECMIRLAQSGITPDIMTVLIELRETTNLTDAELLSIQEALHKLAEATSYTLNPFAVRARLCAKLAEIGERARRFHVMHEYQGMLADPHVSLEQAQGWLVKKLEEASRPVLGGMETSLAEIGSKVDALLSMYRDAQDAMRGVTSGLFCLDRLTRGFRKGALWLIGGRSSMGKTSFALGIARSIGKVEAQSESGGQVLIFSLEMSKEDLYLRMLAAEANVAHARLEAGDETLDWSRIRAADLRLRMLPIRIIDAQTANARANGLGGRMSVGVMANLTRTYRRMGPVAAVFVDYLELVEDEPGSKRFSRDETLGSFVAGMKRIAEEHQTTVFTLSQLSQRGEGGDELPQLSHFRYGAEATAHADGAITIYRPAFYQSTGAKVVKGYENLPEGAAIINVCKNRRGERKILKAYFHGEAMEFLDADYNRGVVLRYDPVAELLSYDSPIHGLSSEKEEEERLRLPPPSNTPTLATYQFPFEEEAE